MSTEKRIVLLGAYGYTAQLIAARLDRAGIPFSIAGRLAAKLKKMEEQFPCIISTYCLDAENETDLQELYSKTDVLINCIGPYNLYGSLILKKCMEAGIIYMDICGEQYFVHHSLMNHQEMAIAHGATVFHSLAFESTLADLIAKCCLPKDLSWKEISTLYFFNKIHPSSGTRLSMQTSSFFPVFYLKERNLTESKISDFSKNILYPGKPGMNAALFTPYPEILFFSKQYLPVQSYSYLIFEEAEIKYFLSDNRAKSTLAEVLERSKKRNYQGPDDKERKDQYFEIILFAETPGNERFCFSLSGEDMYGITASIVQIYLDHIIHAENLPKGILLPSEVDDAVLLFEKILAENTIELKAINGFSFVE
jgi:short subunit dehydrogenase-like uncharacterized protein